jgi:serine/threonine-protein kinase
MAEDAQQGPLGLGDKFLKYSIRETLARGGHSWVYAARDDFFDRDVAIKILHRPGGVTADMLRRGRAEAQLLNRLRHPNVVEVFDAGITNDGQLYIVMELLRGRTLRQILGARGRLSVRETLSLFIAVANGVQAAHDLGAIHRDLKPENLFVLENGTPKILDFGVAKIVDSAGWSTRNETINGSVLYLSPEQLRGFRSSARSDVYAIGLVLYEVLLGKHPCLLSNSTPTLRDLSLIQRVEEPPLLNELEASIPHHVARAVARALAKLPEKRVASMIELRESLTTCLERIARPGGDAEPMRRSTPSSTPPAIEPLARSTELPNTAPPVTTPASSDWNGTTRSAPDERQYRRRRVVVAGALVGTLLAAAAFFLLFERSAAISGPATAGAALSATPSAANRAGADDMVTAGAHASASGTPSAAPTSTVLPTTSAASSLGATSAAKASPTATAPRSSSKKHKPAPVAPEREVWIE